ncbi:response regulator [Oligoflexaceae bacterium]|nr:response regulator [Oligoflexaceae bacterium]
MKLANKKILVVDDEPEILAFLADMLELEGATVTTAANGKIAYDHIIESENLFCAIVSDIRMPVMSGLELLKKLKSENKKPDNFIFISGFSDISLEDALSQGASAVVNKPFDIDKITSLCAAK